MRPTLLATGALLALGVSACRERPAPAPVAPAPPEAVLTSTVTVAEVPSTPEPPVPVEMPSLAPLVERILPTVVSVEANPGVPHPDDDEEEDDGAQPQLPEGHPSGPGGFRTRERAGAGVLVGGRGLVLTSFHFVRDADNLLVHFADGRTYDAALVARDAPTDLALLRLRNAPKGHPVARLGDSKQLHTGDWVLAVGSPFGLTSSVSLGIVSAIDRRLGGPYDEFLQTDAAINPGSSGGPLFDLQGRVVGIATAIPVAAGIGFAIPSALVVELLPQLEKEGGVTRGALGALFQDITPALARVLGVGGGQGALVSGFTADSAAERAGLRRDDVVVAVDGSPVVSRIELIRTVALHPPASTVRLTLVRSGQAQDVRVTLGTRTDLEGTGPLARPALDELPSPVAAPLGLELRDLSRGLAARLHIRDPGAVVVAVLPGSAAEAAGLVPGMVITELGGSAVRTASDARAALKQARGGRGVLVRTLAPGGIPGLLVLNVP